MPSRFTHDIQPMRERSCEACLKRGEQVKGGFRVIDEKFVVLTVVEKRGGVVLVTERFKSVAIRQADIGRG